MKKGVGSSPDNSNSPISNRVGAKNSIRLDGETSFADIIIIEIEKNRSNPVF